MNLEENSIDLRELFAILAKNVRKIGVITITFIIISGIYLFITPRVYESDSLLRIKQPQGLGSSLLDAVPGANTQVTAQLMSTYAEILKSRSVIEPIIQITEEADDEGRYPSYDGYIKNRVSTTPFKNTEILKVTVNAETPEAAQQANQLLVDGFLSRLTELTRAEQRSTKEFIAERVGEAKKELTLAEQNLQEYKEVHKILDPTENIKVVADKITMVDKVAAENEVNRATAAAKLASINSQLAGAAQATADSTTIKNINAKLAELEMARIEYLNKYTEKHPKMQEVEQEIAGVKSQLATEIQKVAALQAPSDNPVHQGLIAGKFQSEAELAVADAKQSALANIETSNNEIIKKLPEMEQGYLRVAREADVAQEIYIMLAKRLEEAKVAEVMVSNEVQVVDTATLPENPVKPRKALTLALAALLGLMAGSGFVLAHELFNRKLKTADDIEHFLGLPVIGSVPDFASVEKAAQDSQKEQGLWSKLWGWLTK
ncbi:MAG TPA: chain-length determining protein [Candidatus Avacidaminococcus intestinavium]|uniref:Chain-length determining protein n=1 Tax=Candidatus Avacidaminococcus intestinavium TaxID=2840684 RepID=A0A9D1MRB9_9FIRM|nr:chain-length determining protein [Candidatus Avacidaminococcus intestinavium]